MRYLGVYIGQAGLLLVGIGALGYAVTSNSRFESMAVSGLVVGFFGAVVFFIQQLIR